MIRIFTTLFGVGHLRPAPGTWGSLAAVALAFGLHLLGGPLLLILAFALVTAAASPAIRAHIAGGSDSDPPEVVIDEVAGQWLALIPVSIGAWHAGAPPEALYPGWIAAFLLFRLFDIWKPGPVGRADAKGTPWGVVEDDLWAGLFAGIGTMALAAFSHGVLMR